MGTRITAKGVDAEAYATEMGVPVRTGIRGVFLTNTSLEKIVWNYAPGSTVKGVESGEAAVTPQFASLDGLASGSPKYVDTKISETTDFTFFFIAKFDTSSPDWPATPGTTLPQNLRGHAISNYGGASVGHGVGYYATRNNALAISMGVIKSDLTEAQETVILPVDLSKYVLCSGKYDTPTRTITVKNHITGVSVPLVITADSVRKIQQRTFRLGAASAGPYGGKINMVLSQIHGTALSASEIDKNAAFLRAYAERKGIVFT